MSLRVISKIGRRPLSTNFLNLPQELQKCIIGTMKREQIGGFLSSYRNARVLFEGGEISSHVVTNVDDLEENDVSIVYHKVNDEDYVDEVNRVVRTLQRNGFTGDVDIHTLSEYSVQQGWGFDTDRVTFNQTLIQMNVGNDALEYITRESLLQSDYYLDFVHELQEDLETEEDPIHTGRVIITIRRTEVVPETP